MFYAGSYVINLGQVLGGILYIYNLLCIFRIITNRINDVIQFYLYACHPTPEIIDVFSVNDL